MHLLILRDVSKTELLFSWTNIPALVNGFTVHDYPFVKISQKFSYQFFSPVVLFSFYHNCVLSVLMSFLLLFIFRSILKHVE